jgi:hypothetical protein
MPFRYFPVKIDLLKIVSRCCKENKIYFFQTESLGYKSLGQRPRYIVDMFRRLKACVIVTFRFDEIKKVPQYTITQAFSLQSYLHVTWGAAPGFYNPDFQSDENAFKQELGNDTDIPQTRICRPFRPPRLSNVNPGLRPGL